MQDINQLFRTYQLIYSSGKNSDRKLYSILTEFGIMLVDSVYFLNNLGLLKINDLAKKQIYESVKKELVLQLSKEDARILYSFFEENKTNNISLEIIKYIIVI